ncbi:MAG: BON domain-containing protein, partial [bacterium]|nr:BON domain-containing protein [bacterium]
LDVNTEVWKGLVLLTGTLDSAAMRSAVEQMARMDSRVRAVYNEILIVTPAEKEERREATQQKGEPKQGKIGQFVNDVWINAKIRAKLLTTRAVKSVNYRWNAVRGQVAIIGTARTEDEK